MKLDAKLTFNKIQNINVFKMKLNFKVEWNDGKWYILKIFMQ